MHYKNQRTSDYFPSYFRLFVYARGKLVLVRVFFLEGVSIGGHNFFGNLIRKFFFYVVKYYTIRVSHLDHVHLSHSEIFHGLYLVTTFLNIKYQQLLRTKRLEIVSTSSFINTHRKQRHSRSISNVFILFNKITLNLYT